jgi:uncharacterized protein (UPF0548 family)
VPFLLGPTSDDRLAAVLRAAGEREPAYGAVGATRTGGVPGGFRVGHLRADITADDPDGAFAAGVRALRGWEVHRGARAPVFPAGAALVEGETVVVTLRLLPPSLVTMAAPCRVVYVTDEPDRFGFGYGTLPGHPEVGEEAFHVVRMSEGVRFEVDVFWKPVHPLVRLGGPVSRWVQAMMTRRYLAAFRRAVT